MMKTPKYAVILGLSAYFATWTGLAETVSEKPEQVPHSSPRLLAEKAEVQPDLPAHAAGNRRQQVRIVVEKPAASHRQLFAEYTTIPAARLFRPETRLTWRDRLRPFFVVQQWVEWWTDEGSVPEFRWTELRDDEEHRTRIVLVKLPF